jgi:hypothetical protein
VLCSHGCARVRDLGKRKSCNTSMKSWERWQPCEMRLKTFRWACGERAGAHAWWHGPSLHLGRPLLPTSLAHLQAHAISGTVHGTNKVVQVLLRTDAFDVMEKKGVHLIVMNPM